ncbi:MAG: hypothetical protein U0Q16_23285 [Bryobacteraceae bacterium]
MTASREDLARALATANGFTVDELETNRAGRIAPAQNRRLWAVALEPFRTALMALAGWLVFLAIVRILVPRLLLAAIESAIGVSLYVLFFLITITTALAFLGKLLGAIRISADLARDVMQEGTESLEGRVSISSTNEELHGMGELYETTEDRYGYAIGSEVFPVSEAAYRAYREYSGSTCRVFVTPRSRLLLSIEPVNVRRTDRRVK